MISAVDVYFWEELIAPLRSLGRDDLAAAIEVHLKKRERYVRRAQVGSWRAAVKRLDAKVLGGTLVRLRGLARGRR